MAINETIVKLLFNELTAFALAAILDDVLAKLSVIPSTAPNFVSAFLPSLNWLARVPIIQYIWKWDTKQ